jgi:Domain of unknown function (4846)
MMLLWPYYLLLSLQLIFSGCQDSSAPKPHSSENTKSPFIIKEGNTIATRFLAPSGFERTKEDSNSFGAYLRNLPLFPAGRVVKYYNGEEKQNHQVYAAVINLPIGKRDLHQCADAVMRLRADYLRSQQRTNEIHFHFTNGFDADYQHWINGYRVQINGNKCEWKPSPSSSGDSDESYWKYLETVFTYAGTLSLSKELSPQEWNNMKIGDVLIQGGSPGHVVIVVDMAINKTTKEKMYMLAQSYMPAQELQVLLNPVTDNVWYSLSAEDPIETPEWTFEKSHLRKFL